jgi:hypothetical protein
MTSVNDNFEKIQSFNLNAFIPTIVLFVLGLIYYYFKFRTIQENISGNISHSNNHSQRVNDNIENRFNNAQENDSISSNSDIINIYILIENQRKHFQINKNFYILDFVNNQIKPTILNFSNEKTINLICQGRRLDQTKKFSDYTNIENNTVLHCFIVTNADNIRSHRQDQEDFSHSQLLIDDQAVSIYTLITHIFIFIFLVLIILTYKNAKEYISTGAILIFQIIAILWVNQLSKCIAKLAINKKIVYN